MRTIRPLVFLAALASAVATSGPSSDWVDSDVFLFNRTDAPLQVEAERIQRSLDLDCELIAANPSMLGPELFAPSHTLTLEPGELFSIHSQEDFDFVPVDQFCDAYRITVEGLGTQLLFWRTDEVLFKGIEDDVEISSLPRGTVVLGGAGLAFNDGGLGITFDPDAPLPVCPEETRIEWDGPDQGTFVLGDSSREAGCTTWPLLAIDDGEPESLELCVPAGVLEVPGGTGFQTGDTVRVFGDDEAYRVSQEGERELELILSVVPERAPYALFFAPSGGQPVCATGSIGQLAADLPIVATTGFAPAEPIPAGQSVRMELTALRDGLVHLDRNLTNAVAGPATLPQDDAFAIAVLSWRAR